MAMGSEARQEMLNPIVKKVKNLKTVYRILVILIVVDIPVQNSTDQPASKVRYLVAGQLH